MESIFQGQSIVRMVVIASAALVLAGCTTTGEQAAPDTVDNRQRLATLLAEGPWESETEFRKALDKSFDSLPPEQQANAQMLREALTPEDVKQAYIEASMATYTAEEMAAQHRFWGSPQGRSIRAKKEQFNAAFRKQIDQRVINAFVNVYRKKRAN